MSEANHADEMNNASEMNNANAYAGRDASVVALSITGPRRVNEDRASAVISEDDGSWVIAVADGLGGHVRGDEAAQAAIEGLPQRIGSADEMAIAFGEANERVLALTTEETWSGVGSQFLMLDMFPMSTLCVASWTPEGGLFIGWMGDTLPFLARLQPGGGFSGFLCGLPHRMSDGSIKFCLGMPPVGGLSEPGVVEVEIIGESGDGIVPDAVILASDGAWEPFVNVYDTEWLADSSVDGGIGAACGSQTQTASQIAESILAEATRLGLNDNASIAAALWS